MDSIKFTSTYIENDNESMENKIYTTPQHMPRVSDVKFWSENPNILLDSKYVLEFFPVEEMTYNQKLNAISRTIIILILLSFVFTQNVRVLVIGIITLFSIYLLHYYKKIEHTKGKKTRGSENMESENVEFENMGEENIDEEKEGFDNLNNEEEGFKNPALEVLKHHKVPLNVFDKPSSANPFSNVLLPDYQYNTEKKPAPASFTLHTNNDILEKAKQLVIDANPGQPDIADKLFKDLGEQFVFEQSLQPFYSNPSTTISNDQAAFADFCYGGMVSCKEGNLFACARNLDRYTN